MSAVYEEVTKQDILITEPLQLFRDTEKIWEYTAVESQKHHPVIRNVNQGQIVFDIAPRWSLPKHFFVNNFFFQSISLHFTRIDSQCYIQSCGRRW